MQWFLLALWSAVIFLGSRRNAVWLRPVLSCGLASAMGTQLLLLKLDDMLTWEAVLPLHLCSLFGVLCIGMVWRTPKFLYDACCFLGAPGAFLTLFFPAVVNCSHPHLMRAAFYQLHALVALMPFFWHMTGKPLPNNPRFTLILGNGYLLFVWFFNRIFGTNYLFLRAAPLGTPLAVLLQNGLPFYLCAIEMLCMMIFSWLKPVYAYSRK